MIYLLATLDTKGPEAKLVRDRLHELGHRVCAVDVGCIGEPTFPSDITREEVFSAAGSSLADMVAANDRGLAVTTASVGAEEIIRSAFESGECDGVIALGGSAGTTIGSRAMRALPLGVPKVMVSTLASGQVRQWVGDKDICMFNSVVDIAGVNRISRAVLCGAAAAIAGMVGDRIESSDDDKPLIAATMFGVTTPCVLRAKEVLEDAGYEVLVFHATGNGGQAMESLIAEGQIAGVLDLTTTELADELVGGILSAGPERLTAASQMGVPQVVSVGATDMVNFGPRESVPAQFGNRTFYQHNETVTLMRTTAAENSRLGEEIARKVATANGPSVLMLPLAGVSAIDREGQPFDDPTARAALFASVREHRGKVELVESESHINDREFAEAAARKLIELIASRTVDEQ